MGSLLLLFFNDPLSDIEVDIIKRQTTDDNDLWVCWSNLEGYLPGSILMYYIEENYEKLGAAGPQI
jgi:hypothetical protein